MLSPFICGAPHHEDEDDVPLTTSSAPSTPRRSRRNGSGRNHSSKADKNPYSSRGLDKFSALLADLEEKRRKIYAETGAHEDLSLVRFVYKNSNDCVPIVIKLKDNKDDKPKAEQVKEHNKHATEEVPKDKLPTETSTAVKEDDKQSRSASGKRKTYKKSFSWNLTKMVRWNRPSFYLPVFVVLILLFLAVFGRSVAILCTSIGWYMVPTLNETTMKRRSFKKKDYVRKLSEAKMAVGDGLPSPKANHKGAVKDKSPPKRGHRQSW